MVEIRWFGYVEIEIRITGDGSDICILLSLLPGMLQEFRRYGCGMTRWDDGRRTGNRVSPSCKLLKHSIPWIGSQRVDLVWYKQDSPMEARKCGADENTSSSTLLELLCDERSDI